MYVRDCNIDITGDLIFARDLSSIWLPTKDEFYGILPGGLLGADIRVWGWSCYSFVCLRGHVYFSSHSPNYRYTHKQVFHLFRLAPYFNIDRTA